MTLRFGAIEVRPATRQVYIEGQVRPLGARAFDLLVALVERRERMVPKHELMDIVWPGLVVEENNLSVQISALRRLLGPTAIATIPGRGYRFSAGEVDEDPAKREVDTHSPADAVSAPAAASAVVPCKPGNLPTHLAPLFGRDAALRALLGLIDAHPLVTLVGAAGVGKTVLAQAAAYALRDCSRDGAWFVELAAVTDPAQLVHAVARALRIALPAAASAASAAQDHLVSVLGSMSMLLVLDNCEHVIDAVGALVEAITTRAPRVRVLTTSQVLLNVPSETLYRLSPLALPEADPSPAAALEFGAIRLFVERARAGDLQFALTTQNTRGVADICRRLDGLPLAIELAAARVRLLGVVGLHDRLGERFRVLTGGARTAMRRHQALQAAIDWSHALLSRAEQTVLRRLGVFLGGFTLELAQQVAQDEQLDRWAVLDALGGLADKSLVVADASEPPRYRLLETTRAYALERLAEAGETQTWHERHARSVCELFERTEEARAGEQGTLSDADFVQRLSPEMDNMRAALEWAGGAAADLNLAVGLAGPAAMAYAHLGLSLEGLSRLAGLAARIDDSVDPQRAARFWHRFSELGVAGRLPTAVVLAAADRAQRFYRATGSPRRLFQALRLSARLAYLVGDLNSAQALLHELVHLEDPNWPVWLRSESLNLQGKIHHARHRFDESLACNLEQRALLLGEPGERRALIWCQSNICLDLNMMQRFDESIALARSVIEGERGERPGSMVFLWMRLAHAQAFHGRLDDAWQTVRLAMPSWRRDGAVFWASGLMAMLLAERGRFADAAGVGGAASAFQRRAALEWLPSYQRENARLQELLAAGHGKPDDLDQRRREGQALDEAAIAAICLREEKVAG